MRKAGRRELCEEAVELCPCGVNNRAALHNGNHIDFTPRRGLRDSLIHELKELLASFQGRLIGLDLARSHLDRRKQN